MPGKEGSTRYSVLIHPFLRGCRFRIVIGAWRKDPEPKGSQVKRPRPDTSLAKFKKKKIQLFEF